MFHLYLCYIVWTESKWEAEILSCSIVVNETWIDSITVTAVYSFKVRRAPIDCAGLISASVQAVCIRMVRQTRSIGL